MAPGPPGDGNEPIPTPAQGEMTFTLATFRRRKPVLLLQASNFPRTPLSLH